MARYLPAWPRSLVEKLRSRTWMSTLSTHPAHLSTPAAQPRVPGLFAAVTGLSVGAKKKARPIPHASLPPSSPSVPPASLKLTRRPVRSRPLCGYVRSPQVSLSAAEAYGEKDPANMVKVPRDMAPDVKAGDKVRSPVPPRHHRAATAGSLR